MEDKILSKNKDVYKKDNMVIRPLEKWSKNIHLLMDHFYNNGLPISKLIKIDQKYEYTEYINGEMIHPNKWTDEGLFEIGKLIKNLHDMAKKFEHNNNMDWKQWYLRELGKPEICSHGDIAPWNIITKENKIIGLIDWECAGPIDPIIELARVCWLFPQLHDDDIGKLYNLPPPEKEENK